MKIVIELIQRLVKEGFWGEITITFRDGKMKLLTKSEQIKIEE